MRQHNISSCCKLENLRHASNSILYNLFLCNWSKADLRYMFSNTNKEIRSQSSTVISNKGWTSFKKHEHWMGNGTLQKTTRFPFGFKKFCQFSWKTKYWQFFFVNVWNGTFEKILITFFSVCFCLISTFRKFFFHAVLKQKVLIIQYLMSEEFHVQNILGNRNSIS